MRDPVKTEVYLDFDVPEIIEDMDDGVLEGCRKATIKMVSDAERRFRSKTQGLGTGEMASKFGDFKSHYAKESPGWVGGIFGSAVPKDNQKTKSPWGNSVGGRAHFFEYGRSQPGFGKAHGGPQPIWIRRILGQPPRMFLRPAMNKVKRELGGITKKEIKTVARKLNKSVSLSRSVMRTANRIA